MTILTDSMRTIIHNQLIAKPLRKSAEVVSSYRYNKGKPFHSDALGVGVDQVDEARANLRKHGVYADFTNDGECIIESEKQFREVAKAGGLWNGASGYGAFDSNGNKIMTGREQVEGRKKLQSQLERMACGYPKN